MLQKGSNKSTSNLSGLILFGKLVFYEDRTFFNYLLALYGPAEGGCQYVALYV